ncbi:cyclin-dependent protein kinase inhibitor SMR4 [Rosa rugosa]|uniref:cyclin-dependent protein kinase inhibitor SMR4 n=1 Tax=Rosa rugosa TaxID=74645 RepID=UPI002B40E03D|nr:cyclin-dependent protein kinase inhibitor SMR4 [Rosa rugosa]
MERCDEDCTTPKRRECRIPESSMCPPAPRKKVAGDQNKRDPPKNGYFQPPDLDSLFNMLPRTQVCA